MMRKLVIWIQGSNGAGKTTQSRLLIDHLTKGVEEVDRMSVIDDKCYYTRYGSSGVAVLGKIGKNACTGLDSVYSKLGADGVGISLEKALDDEEISIIVMECVFGTMAWYNRWISMGIRDKFKLFVFHLDFTMWDNFNRISQRRALKQERDDWWNVPLEDTVYKNVGSKNRETRTIFNKLNGTHEKSDGKLAEVCFQLDAIEPSKVIHNKIVGHIFNNL